MRPFDLQVNGYAGVDFNHDGLTGDGLHTACECLREDGVDGILATIITAEVDVMCRRLRRLVELIDADDLAQDVVEGVHIEGPFLNETPGFIGAHPADAARIADVETMKRLFDACDGTARLVTLAPERDEGCQVTRYLSRQGICIAAGHCDPTRNELEAAIDAGLSMFTHVGNGCPMEMHRHDNVIQRALSLRDALWLCFIPDGVHIPFMTLKNYLRCAGVERSIFVTDAISPARLGPGTYTLGDQEIEIGTDLVARAPDESHFMGSTVTMPRILENARAHLDLTPQEVELLTSANPRKALGRIAAG